MKKLTFILLTMILSACGEHATSEQAGISKSTFIILESGGTVADHQKEQSSITALNLLQQLAALDRFKATRDTKIYIIKTSHPNMISWTGSPAQLLGQAEDVKSLIQYEQSFSDITLAYQLVEDTINITQPSEVSLYQIGPFIDARFEATKGEIEINLPQKINKELALPHFLDRLKTLKLYMVSPDQTTELISYFSEHGVLKRAKNGTLDFSLKGAAETRASLSNLL